MDPAVFNILARIAAEKDESQKARLKEESAALLAAHFAHPAHAADLQELAFDLLNLAWTDAMVQDIVPSIIEVKTVGLGDPDYVDEDLRGMRAYWQGKGGQILSDVVRYERRQMPREEMVAAIDMHQDEIALNFWGTIDKLRNQAQEKLRQLPTTRLIELIRAAITSGSYYGTFAASTMTADQIRAVVQSVAAKSGGTVSILGTGINARSLPGRPRVRPERAEQHPADRSAGCLRGLARRPGPELRGLRGQLGHPEQRALGDRPQRGPPDVLRRHRQGPGAAAALVHEALGDREGRRNAPVRS